MATRGFVARSRVLLPNLSWNTLVAMRDSRYRSNDQITAYMKDTMKAKGVTQADMAAASNHAQSYIAKHLMGKATWKLDDVEAIAPLFGFPNALSFMSAATGTGE